MANLNPNTQGIVKYKKQESERKKEAVLAALKELISEGEQITKAEICRRAGVSKTFLYGSGEELLRHIEEAEKLQDCKTKVGAENKSFSDCSKDRVIETLKRRIKNLEEENSKLKRDNAVLLGKVMGRTHYN